MTSKRFVSLSLALSSILFVGCATSPEGRRQAMLVSEAQMDTMGAQAFDQMKSETPVERDAATNAYVRCISDAITTAMPEQRAWEVVVFRDESANAFALPGGKIGVHTGLLKVAQTADQLAAVIGHEVGHVIARHGAERVSEQMVAQGVVLGTGLVLQRQNMGEQKFQVMMAALGLGAQFGVLLPHSRDQESEADIIGLKLMASAGFNPTESVTLWQNMAKSGGAGVPEFMSTHPGHDTRISNLSSRMTEARGIYENAKSRPNCRR
ncbi:MAG: M48 family metallopeptidase [Bdellovibrionota bacterium]